MSASLNEDFRKFKNRECKAKDVFSIKEINKNDAYEFVRKYHYLADAKFLCKKAYGLFSNKTNQLLGCATYSPPQGISTLKGWFGLTNQTNNIFELSRLCMLPILNKTNATSFLLGGSIKSMKKANREKKHQFKKEGKLFTSEDYECRAIITFATSQRHVGSIYQVCNFKYYGLSDLKSDLYCEDGRLNPRGKTSDVCGVWLPRARKHRYAFILDPLLKANYTEQKRPGLDQVFELDCCNGSHEVYDNRFDRWYTCPRCTGKLERIYKKKGEKHE